jgi:hypothetical protein
VTEALGTSAPPPPSGRALLLNSVACAGGWAWSRAPSFPFLLRSDPPSPHLRKTRRPGARFGGPAAPSPLLPLSWPVSSRVDLCRPAAL